MSKPSEKSRRVKPVKGLRGEISLPGDKSISHRAVMLGSIAEGMTRITGLLEGEDNLSTIKAFRQMGVEMHGPSNGKLAIEGVGLHGLEEPGGIIDCGNSGTTARLMSGILSATDFSSVMTGDDSLRIRPMARVVDPLLSMDAKISYKEKEGCLPLEINGGPLKAINYKTPIASAQLKSALLLAGLYAEGTTVIEEPALSRDHTERMLSLFGAKIERDGLAVSVTGGGALKGVDLEVPGDISSAAFFIVAASITRSSEILIKNVGVNPTRFGIIHIIKRMGGNIELMNLREGYEPVADIVVKSAPLNGVEIDGDELLSAIDEFPIIAIAAAFAKGSTFISGAEELRVKESDRVTAMASLLTSLGAVVTEAEDGLEIEGRPSLRGGKVNSFGDHRVAMAAAVAALASKGGVEIEGPGCVDVSFPGFFEKLAESSI